MKRLASVLAALAVVCAACGGGGPSSDATSEVAPESETLSPAATEAPIPEEPVAAEPTSAILFDGTDDEFETGEVATVIVPADGLPFVVYLARTGSAEGDPTAEYRAVKCTDPGCEGQSTEVAFALRADALEPAELTLDENGLPAFVYVDRAAEEEDTERFERGLPPDDRLHLVRCSDPTCSEYTDTDLGPGYSPSLMIRADGTPLIAHGTFGESREDLGDWNLTEVISCADPVCADQTRALVGDLRYAWNTPLLVGSDGLPIVAYAMNEPLGEEDAGAPLGGEVGVVLCRDSSCTAGDHVSVAITGEGPELVGAFVDGEGPVFAYLDGTQLHLARCLDAKCRETAPVSLVGPPMMHEATTMAVGEDGIPVFAFGVERDQTLVVARCTDVECVEGTFSQVAEGWFPTIGLALDAAGNPVIASTSPPEVAVIHCADPGCLGGMVPAGVWNPESSVYEMEPLGPVMEGWHLASTLGPGGGGGLLEVMDGGPGLLAIGEACGVDEAGNTADCYLGVWGSADGREWSQVADLGPGDVRTVARSGPVLIIGGSSCEDAGPMEDRRCEPGLWTSTDGIDWTVASADDEVFPGCTDADPEWCGGGVESIVALPSGGLWAFGWSRLGTTSWTSTDGLEWVLDEAPFTPLADVIESDWWWLDQAFAGGDGIVLCATECVETGFARLGVGVSPAEAGEAAVVDMVWDDSGAAEAGLAEGDLIVAIDGDPVSDPESLVSLVVAHQPGDLVVVSLVRDGDGLDLEVVLGSSEDWFCDLLMATSADGGAWRQLVAPIDSEGDTSFGQVMEWAGGLASNTETCDQDYNCEGQLLTSTDGVEWQVHSLEGVFGDIYMGAIHPFEEGFLAIGDRGDEQTGESQGAFGLSPAGITWTVYAADPEVFPGGMVGINDLIEFGDGVVAVGSTRTGPTVWWYEG